VNELLRLLGETQATPVGILLFLAFAFYKRWIVLGSTYEECTEERDTFRKAAENEARTNNEELRRLRDDLMRGRSENRP
jgi:hypothetical protein